MGYIRQGFADGQKLKAEHLTHIEDGIIALKETQQSLGDQIAAAEESIEEFRFVVSASGERIVTNDASNRILRGLTVYGKSVQNGVGSPAAPMMPVNSGAENGIINVYALNGISDAQPIITEISYPVTVVEGEYAVFSVKAIGHGLTYQWQFKNSTASLTWQDSTSATQGYNTDTITVFANESRNGRPFRCVITDANGNTAISDEMLLILGEETVYTEQVYFDMQQLSIPIPGGLPGLPVSRSGNYTDENGQMWLSNTKSVDKDAEFVKLFEFDADSFEKGSSTYTAKDGTTILHMYMVKGQTMDFAYSGGVSYGKRLMFSHGAYRSTNSVTSIPDLSPGDLFAYTSLTAPTPGNTWMGFLSIIPTLEEFKAWVTAQKEAGTPPTALYVLKEPVVTEHDPIELHTYKPNTTIVNDAGAYMEVEYVADPKTYIDNKFAQLAVAVAGN